uniref:Myb-binding protein 1A n=1 Tax=Lygus hesperus TaxID=30085 RepID=A0A0A9XMD9_LYGHE
MTRFKINVQLNEKALNKKLMVFHEESWRKVEDLENHIKRILKLGDLQLELYVEDFWVPSCEKISVIKPYDAVIVKEAAAPSVVESSSSNRVTSHGKCTKREKKNSEDLITNNNSAIEEEELLSSKKQELLSQVALVEEEEMDVTDFGDEPPKKRKRKRKHKKSSKIPLLAGITLDSQQYTPTEPTKPTEVTTRLGHVRFYDEEDIVDTAAPNSHVEETPENEWQQKLLSLAQERSKIVFTRTPFTNGVNGDAHVETETNPSQFQTEANVKGPPVASTVNSEHEKVDSLELSAPLPLESLKASDLIHFKKLTMKDSTPTVSNFLLAVLEEIELGERNVLTLKICEGHSDETFLAEELQESEGDSLIVKLEWSQILEPRLVTSQTVLSKYL